MFLSCAVRDGEDPSHLGLITGHAYSILKVQLSKDGKQFVQVYLRVCVTYDIYTRMQTHRCVMFVYVYTQVRNPWGQSEWSGDYSDASDKWTGANVYPTHAVLKIICHM